MARRRGDGGSRSDRGSVTTELVLLTPLIMLLLQFVVFTGRFVDARSDVVSAARDGARAASIQRSSAAAQAAASDAVNATLADEGIECAGDAAGVSVAHPGGYAPGNFVRVTVTCDVKLSGLGWLGVGSASSEHTAVEIIDVFRG